ncbi:hypothetical protein LXL04_000844 [Taraxacum kok-saghyz]
MVTSFLRLPCFTTNWGRCFESYSEDPAISKTRKRWGRWRWGLDVFLSRIHGGFICRGARIEQWKQRIDFAEEHPMLMPMHS